MNTSTRALIALFAPVLVAGTAVAATAGSASAAPGTPEATPGSVCFSVGGYFGSYDDGSWDCYYEADNAAYESSLASVCGSTIVIHRLPANGVVPTPSTTFQCLPTLIN